MNNLNHDTSTIKNLSIHFFVFVLYSFTGYMYFVFTYFRKTYLFCKNVFLVK